jgi:hypothetical protein
MSRSDPVGGVIAGSNLLVIKGRAISGPAFYE